MLSDGKVHTMLPVKDLKEAERFYGGTLGLRKIAKRTAAPSPMKAAARR